MFDVELVNRTPFAAATHVQLDGAGQELLVAVMCATFAAAEEGGPLGLATPQDPVRFGDEPRGDPARSSVAFEADIVPFKPRVDVIVVGHAQAPVGRHVTELDVVLQVADIHKRLQVSGDRPGRRNAPLVPFTAMPIVYERAFGGTADNGECCRENPVGIGFRDAVSTDATAGSVVPNIAYADPRAARLGDHVLPAGLGCIARHWLPRLARAGTYDQRWLDTTWPLPPADFDPQFHQSAPLDQQTARIDGGERVTLQHMSPSGAWQFQLPRLDVPMHLIYADRVVACQPRIDTVAIDADRRRVTLKARLAIQHVRNAPALRAVVLGHVSPAWLRARQRLKVWRGAGAAAEAEATPACFHP